MPTAPQIDAPLSLGSFFPSDDCADEDNEGESFDQCYETQEVILAKKTMKVRQYAYHSHNANRVWPGTFNLADYLFQTKDNGEYKHHWGYVLELGTATGLLGIRLAKSCAKFCFGDDEPVVCSDVVTSDVDDEHGEVEENVLHNFDLNGLSPSEGRIPTHVPHTWGTGWKSSATKIGLNDDRIFDTIVASDILLYVSSYPALVKTLSELMKDSRENKTVFVMSWNRRMKESEEFFERMKEAGFQYSHEGKCVYRFTYDT